MGWWGKMSGGILGAMAGGPVAALFGAGLGHHLDREVDGFAQAWFGTSEPDTQRRRQAALVTAGFALAGHLARAGGQDLGACRPALEALAAHQGLTGEARQQALDLFRDGQRADFPLQAVSNQFRRASHRRPDLRFLLLEHLLLFLYWDGSPTPAQQRALTELAVRWGIPALLLERFEQEVRERIREVRPGRGPAMDVTAAYQVLEITAAASDAEVKRAYRRLMSRHHPDKLEHQGLGPERLAEAAAKTHWIRKAYETIRQARGW